MFGRKKHKLSAISCLVIGEDRTLDFRNEESTGLYLVDQANRLAYDSYPEAVGTHSMVSRGRTRNMGQVCVLYEPMSRPWSFKTNTWMTKEMCRKKDVILANARAEGYSMAIQRKDDDDRAAKMQLALLLLIGLFGTVVLMFVFQSGLIKSLFGG